jgi:DNA-binding protein YbaB
VIKADEADLLEDLVLAAFNDARAKITRMVEEEMEKISGGMGLPKGLF